jgi:hypothetical protein
MAGKAAIMNTVKVGNIYKCKGGGKTSYWVVAGIRDRTVALIGYDKAWRVSSAVAYGIHVFEGPGNLFVPRELLGFIPEFESFKFSVHWVKPS